MYYELLSNIKEIELIYEDKDSFHSYHTFIIKASYRDKLKRYLLDKGIETKIHYPILIHQQPTFKNRNFYLPKSEELNKMVLTLPLDIIKQEIEIVANEIKNFYEANQ